MNLKQLFQRWIETNDMDMLFRAFRKAKSDYEQIGMDGTNEQSDLYDIYEESMEEPKLPMLVEIVDQYNELVNIYYDRKENDFDQNEYNRQLEKLLMVIEGFITVVIGQTQIIMPKAPGDMSG